MNLVVQGPALATGDVEAIAPPGEARGGANHRDRAPSVSAVR